MKLLMISGYGATEIVRGKRGAFYNTLEELHKYWDSITILAPGGKWLPKLSEKINIFGNVTIHTSPFPLWMQAFWIARKGVSLYDESQYDIVVVHEYVPGYNGSGARKLHRRLAESNPVPFVFEIFHVPGHPRAATLKERIYKRIARSMFRKDAQYAKAIRVMNKTEVPEFLKSAGVPEDKIVTIPAIYVDDKTFKPLDIEKRYDIIFVGRLAKNKGVDLLIDAIPEVANRVSELKVLIVGEGSEKNNIQKAIAKKHLNDIVELHGWAKDSTEVAYLMNQSKVLVMTSYNEGGPRVIFEAMACAIPIVTTKVGVVHDVVRDGETGLFVDWNSRDIAEKLVRILNNYDLRKTLAQNGHLLAQKFEKTAAIKYYANKLSELTRT